MDETTYSASFVEVTNVRDHDKDNSVRETATAALAVSIGCLILCIIMLVVLYAKFRKMAAEQEKQITDLKRLSNDQEYYIDNVSRKLNQEIMRVQDLITKLVKPEEFRELKSKAMQHEQILEEVRNTVSDDMNPDIFLMSLKMKDFEDKFLDLEKKLEIVEYENSKPKQGMKDKGLGTIQNNRLFEEIMKYRGKIVHLEKKDEDKRKKLVSLEEKLGALMDILNINIVEREVEQSSSADSGATISYKTLHSRSPAIYKTFKNLSGDETRDDVFQETSIDVVSSPSITFQLPPTMYSSSPSNSDDHSNFSMNNQESVA